MKNNLIVKSVSQLTILTVLNFLTAPTWAMPELEEGGAKPQKLNSSRRSAAPSLPPKNNWMDAQIPSKNKPSQNNEFNRLRSHSVLDLPSNRSVNEDNTSEPIQQIPVLKKGEPDQRITSQGEGYTIPEPIFFTLTPKKEEPRNKKWRRSTPSLNIPKSKGIKSTPEGLPTQTHSAKTPAKTLKSRRRSLQLSPSPSNLMLSFRKSEVSKQNEVVEKKGQYTRSELLSYNSEIVGMNRKQIYELGWTYFAGEGRNIDNKRAVYFFKVAARKNHPSAQAALGNCYDKGEGIGQNIKKAKKWNLRAAQNGYAPAQYKLAIYFYHGIGVTPNKKQAKTWYLEAAKRGHLMAQVELGAYYLFDEPFENDEQKYENEKQAAEWLHKAAVRGNERAIALLEELNKTIEGRKKNKNEKEPVGSE